MSSNERGLFFDFERLKTWANARRRGVTCGSSARVEKAAFDIARIFCVRAFLNLRARVIFIFDFTNTADTGVVGDLRRLCAELKGFWIERRPFDFIETTHEVLIVLLERAGARGIPIQRVFGGFQQASRFVLIAEEAIAQAARICGLESEREEGNQKEREMSFQDELKHKIPEAESAYSLRRFAKFKQNRIHRF